MVIQVSQDLEARIREKVEGGDYKDPSSVIQEALRLLDKRDRQTAEIRASIAEGLAAAERGEARELTPELWEEVEREADEMIRLGIPPHPEVCP